MRGLITAVALSFFCAMPASAGVRDAVLGIDGNSALSLVNFDTQPGKAIVRSGPGGVEVLVSGVSADKVRIMPPDPHLIKAIDISPIEGGVRLLYHFKETPNGGNVEVYKNAVLVRVGFDHALKMQTAGLGYGSRSIPVKMAGASTATTAGHASETPALASAEPVADKASPPNPKTARNEAATNVKTPEEAKAPADNTPPNHNSAPLPLRDDDVVNQPRPRIKGTGKIRDASVSQTSQSLDAKSCAAAQKSIEDDPWALDKLSLYAACIAKEGRKDEAREVFERLLTFDPDMISAYMGLGAIAQESGDVAAAKRNYQQALELGGTDAQASQIRSLLGSLGRSR